jgi:hypothetical protein
MSTSVKQDTESNRISVQHTSERIGSMLGDLDIVAAASTELSASVHEFSATIEEISRNITGIEGMANRISQTFELRTGFHRAVGEAAAHFREASAEADSLQEAADAQVRHLRDLFDSDRRDGSRAISLARVFLSLSYSELPAEYRRQIAQNGSDPDPDQRFFCLMGTAGEKPELCDIRGAGEHRYILLPPDSADLTVMPGLEKMFASFGVPYRAIVDPSSERVDSLEGYQLTRDGRESPYIPSSDFTEQFSIRGQVGVGGVLPSGAVFALFIFARDEISDEYAEGLAILAPVLQICYQRFDALGRYWQ